MTSTVEPTVSQQTVGIMIRDRTNDENSHKHEAESCQNSLFDRQRLKPPDDTLRRSGYRWSRTAWKFAHVIMQRGSLGLMVGG